LAANAFLWHGQLNEYGIVPRRLHGLPGILWAPFLHASVQHLVANTVPMLILGGIICGRSPAEFVRVTIGGIILGGGLTWLIARPASHIGASGLIFCFFGYLASLAYFQRTFGALLLSVVCILGYGGIIRGVVPTSGPISWEAHASGLVAGIILASATAKSTRSGRANLFSGASSRANR
jgi:membrane associated rhomboid family serine protease